MKTAILFVWLTCWLHLAPPATASEWHVLYDGRDGGGSLDGWKMLGPGNFIVDRDGSLKSQGGMGLFYYAEQDYEDFELEVEWKVSVKAANSGVFVRFPVPEDPWDAVEGGYEVQIDDKSSGKHATGGIYSFAAPRTFASNPPGKWNRFLIRVQGQQYQISLNGKKLTEYVGERSLRGFVGLQNHDPNSTTWFRLVRIRPLPKKADLLTTLATKFANTAPPIRVLTVTKTHGFRHEGAIATTKALLAELNNTTEFEFTVTEDLKDLHADNLATYDVLFLANATLRVDEPDVLDESVLTFRAGDWKNFDAVLSLGDREIKGRIALSGSPDAMTGLAEFTSGVQKITEASLRGGMFNLIWGEGAGVGRVEVRMPEKSDGKTAGILRAAGQEFPFLATEVATASQRQWDIEDPLTAEHREAILQFLAAGKGIAGAHSALDALYGWSAYRALVGGGLFEKHPWTQEVRITIEDSKNPATQHLGQALTLRDEIYVLDKNPRWTSHVLASLDMSSVTSDPGPADTQRSDFPISWLTEYNGGRVFMTKLGHFPDVWTNPLFVEHLLQGLRIAAGRIPGNFAIRRVKETIIDNVWPDDLAIDEEGNVWVAELRGKVHYYDAKTRQATHVASIKTTDPTKIEHGLMGIEVDPDFHSGSPYIYLYYTQHETFINTLSRFKVVDGRPDLTSEHVLLRVPTEPLCCHQAGDLEWGLGGRLYLSTGDTGMSETRPEWELTDKRIEKYKSVHGLTDHHWSRLADSERSAQNLQDLRGKILRINKDGTIPPDNPFYGQSGVRWEVFAYGLRNPYRIKRHPTTGAIWIGVVGPDARFDYDEYNIAQGGENFGWPRSIGRLFYNDWTPQDIPNYAPPFWEYTYETGGRSASMGPIYNHTGPNGFPSVFKDKIFVYDWARKWIKWADVVDGTFTNDQQNSVKNKPVNTALPTKRIANIKDFDVLTNTTPISMELGPDGALYVAEFDGFWDPGPNAKVSRYRWLRGAQARAYTATQTALSPGEQIYTSKCAACHQNQGQGVPGTFPPLVNTDWVTGDSRRLVEVVLNGLEGEIEVNGATYTGTMAPWRDALSDDEIAKALSYIRTAWGNNASPISPAQVRALR
ncbi:MAG: ThuA domain-containing protein [Pseudomonadota bacterium]|nr:ThuA domain-containing protein [Pseudomonadota bacterium]